MQYLSWEPPEEKDHTLEVSTTRMSENDQTWGLERSNMGSSRASLPSYFQVLSKSVSFFSTFSQLTFLSYLDTCALLY